MSGDGTAVITHASDDRHAIDQAQPVDFRLRAAEAKAASKQPTLSWTKQTGSYRSGSAGNYNSFVVSGSTVTMFNNIGKSTNGKLYKGAGSLSSISAWKSVIAKGPEYELQWLRTPAVSQGASNDWWAVIEATRCYACGAPIYRKVSYSSPDGVNWKYWGETMLDGKPMPSWDGSMALVYQPEKPTRVDMVNLANNRFVYILTTPTPKVCVSADGINFTSVPLPWPIQGDRPVFASLAKTQYGWHILAGDKWGTWGVTYLRHIYSADLRTWKVLESASKVKSSSGYKAGNLYYEAARNRLWAFGPSGSASIGGNLFWITAKGF